MLARRRVEHLACLIAQDIVKGDNLRLLHRRGSVGQAAGPASSILIGALWKGA
jgi:hypothetical protein